MDFTFKEMTSEQIQHIVDEADKEGRFLPQKEEPNFKVSELFKYFMNNKDFYIFAFMEGTHITGFISILPTNEENTLSIGPMYISQRYQGHGLGKKQVIEVIKWAKDKNIKKLYTKTWGQNFRSRRIFESLGFTFVTEISCARINGDSTVKYEYVISEA
jgi:RimJ/RimL family protein N-acetyltransferase